MPNENEDFSRRLVAALERYGQPRRGAGAYLAKKYKVSTVTANAWLNGTHKPAPDTARSIAEDHGVDFDWLYFGAGLFAKAGASLADASDAQLLEGLRQRLNDLDDEGLDDLRATLRYILKQKTQ